jgi:hypothetical protein
MITLEKAGEQDQPPIPKTSIETSQPEYDAQNGSPPEFLPGDTGLMISRALAVIALGIGGYTFLQPSSETYIGSGVLVTCLFAANHVVQKSQQEKALAASRDGMSVKLPANSAIWNVALPFLMSLILIVIAAQLHNQVDTTSATRWMLIAVASMVCPLIISWRIKKAEKHPRLTGLLNGATIGGAMAMFGLFSTAFVICFLDPLSGFFNCSLLVAAVLSLLVIAHTANLTKKLLFRVARQRALAVFSFACAGAALIYFIGMVPELRSAAVSTGERLAADNNSGKSQLGYRLLKQLNATADLERDSQPWYTSPSQATRSPIALGMNRPPSLVSIPTWAINS